MAQLLLVGGVLLVAGAAIHVLTALASRDSNVDEGSALALVGILICPRFRGIGLREASCCGVSVVGFELSRGEHAQGEGRQSYCG